MFSCPICANLNFWLNSAQLKICIRQTLGCRTRYLLVVVLASQFFLINFKNKFIIIIIFGGSLFHFSWVGYMSAPLWAVISTLADYLSDYPTYVAGRFVGLQWLYGKNIVHIGFGIGGFLSKLWGNKLSIIFSSIFLGE